MSKKNRKILILSFVLSATIMTIIYALIGMYPFGNKTVLTMDMSGQYVNFLEYFKNVLIGKANLFYNFSMNLGSNVFGVFAYYASSPLNLILLFFDKSNITEGILILNILKIALSCVTMSYLLLKTTKNKPISIIALSLMYSLMSYNIVYSQNIMWLDGSIYLPLIILGIEKILEKKSSLLFIISFFLCIVSNYYIGYMIGLFVLLYMGIRLFQTKKEKSIKEWLIQNKKIIWNLIKALIITVLLAMIILLPVLLNLIASKMDIKSNIFEFSTYYHPLNAFAKIIIGGFSLDQLGNGAPNIYCGLITILLVFLYFNNKNVKNREKIGYSLLGLILGLSFIIVPLNLIFHMLQPPVWFPFRDSFLFSFCLIIIASKVLENFKEIEFNSFFKTVVLLSFIIMLLASLNLPTYSDKKVVFTIIILIINSIFLYKIYHNDTKIIRIMFIMFISLELIINGNLITNNLDYVKKNRYLKIVNQVEPLIEKYKATDEEFYRIKNDVQRSANDPFLYNYEGYTHYSSLNNKTNQNFLTNYGIRNSMVPENCTDTSIVVQSLLGIKYYMYNPKQMPNQNIEWYKQLEPGVLKNEYDLSLGYASSENIKNLKITNSPLVNQNNLIKAIADVEEDVFKKKKHPNLLKLKKESDEEWYIEYKIRNSFDINEVKIYYNHKLVKKTSDVGLDSNNVIYVPKGITEIEFIPKNKDKITFDIYEYQHEIFEKIYNKIKMKQLNVEVNEDNYLKGKIKVKKPTLLLTSIIDDPGWKVKVDGKTQPKEKIANGLIAFYIEKGNHEVEFIFTPPGLYLGVALFLAGLIWLLLDNKVIFVKIKEKLKNRKH